MDGVYDFETCYRAIASRDQRFDGRFVVAVTTTGVYCRPSCPSRMPRRENIRFFRVPAAAEAARFRACRRCRPDAEPCSPEWNVRGDLVGRALRLIAAGAADDGGVAGLARRLSVSGRHLHRLLVAEVGAGPQALAISRRARTARLLIESGPLPLADVAFAAGYASVRQFNDGIRTAYGCAPSELRRGSAPTRSGGELVLRLRYRPPLDAGWLLQYLGDRALPGVEAVDEGTYRRTVRLPHGPGQIAVEFGDGAMATVRLSLHDLRDVTAAAQRCREVFDLDADPAMIRDELHGDPSLTPLIDALPGLRVPGCADGFEMAVRAVLGTHDTGTVAAVVEQYGEAYPGTFGLAHLFPVPAALAEAPLERTGLAPSRCRTIRALARAVGDGRLHLDRGADREETVAILLGLPGVGPETAAWVAMRALGDPDVLPPSSRAAALRIGLAHPEQHADRWRPWRSYAAMHLLATRLSAPHPSAPHPSAPHPT